MDSAHPQTFAAPAESIDAADAEADLHVPVQSPTRQRVSVLVLLVIAVGGAVGSCARYGASLLWPTPPSVFPWTTLTVNAIGCAAIGVLMVTIDAVPTMHPLVRPFFGTGVLGGFTTFSTYTVDAERLLANGRAGTALAYLVLTVTSALVAVWTAVVAGRSLIKLMRPTRR